MELDGFPAISATEVSMPSRAHTPFEHQPGNQANPDLGRGNFKCEEMTFKHAHGVGGVDEALNRYFDAYLEGLITDKLNGRFIIMDESGLVPTKTYELVDCVPTMFKPEQHTGSGTNTSQFSFGIRPTNYRLV
ncbi:MAG: hypothetical protein WCD76_07025 [Pyrinomonadaceae bacterium]